MSRELKFRAYIKHLKMLVDVDVIDFSEEEIEVFITGSDMHVYRFDEIELIKYTGLKDKNGREIYEGDVYKYLITIGNEFMSIRERRYEQVKYKDGAFWVGPYLLSEAL